MATTEIICDICDKPMPVNFKNYVKYGWIGKEEV